LYLLPERTEVAILELREQIREELLPTAALIETRRCAEERSPATLIGLKEIPKRIWNLKVLHCHELDQT
jgi:hypothetical protein